jgi:hypothetical protein
MILEGLTPHILDYLILPLISIDEYDSKIDNTKAIVVAFYCTQKDPANDLSLFIEKSSIELLDTEVSPAPNPHGCYLVFVEFMRNEKFYKRILDLVDQISNLTNVKEWHFRGYHTPEKDTYPLNKKELKDHVNLTVKPDEHEHTHESIANFFKNSLVEAIAMDGNLIQLRAGGMVKEFEIKSLGSELRIDEAINIDLESTSDARVFNSMLGSNYSVDQFGDLLAVSYGNDVLVLQHL